MELMSKKKTAIIHDWLIEYGGAEGVLNALLEIWPTADVFTIAHDSNGPCAPMLAGHKVYTSFIQKMPFLKSRYRSYFPLMPFAIEQFDLSDYGLVLSSSHAVAKGIITGPNQTHISYVHSPVRYAWDMQFEYLKQSNLEKGLKSIIIRMILHYIRLWDSRTAAGVDYFICNSKYIKKKIKKVYGREAVVIHPPVDIGAFGLKEQKEDYYLTASRLVPYKKILEIVKAFNLLPEKKLIVIGDGPEMEKIKAIKTANITLMGYQPREVVINYMQNAKAFLFMALEDFGIVPVEAQACGTPVIAFGKGGVLETVVNGNTGIFFEEQTSESLISAIRLFESKNIVFCPKNIRNHAERFGKDIFKNEIIKFVNSIS